MILGDRVGSWYSWYKEARRKARQHERDSKQQQRSGSKAKRKIWREASGMETIKGAHSGSEIDTQYAPTHGHGAVPSTTPPRMSRSHHSSGESRGCGQTLVRIYNETKAVRGESVCMRNEHSLGIVEYHGHRVGPASQ